MNGIAKSNDLALQIGYTTEISWAAPSDMSYEEWEHIGRTFQQLGRSLNWWVGDWLNEGERKYGEMYSQALDITGLALETLSKYKRVAARVPPDIRRADLSWSAHFAVAYGEEHLRGPLLEMAAHYSLSSRDLKDIMRLEPEHQKELVDRFTDDMPPTRDIFNQAINELHLLTVNTPVINGRSSAIEEQEQLEASTPLPRVSKHDTAPDEEEESALGPDFDDAPEPELYMEDVLQFWDTSGVSLEYLGSSLATWPGLSVRAGLDTNRNPILVWEKKDGR